MAKTIRISGKRDFSAEISTESPKAPQIFPIAASVPTPEKSICLPLAIGNILTQGEIELFDERAAIREYDGGAGREEAEDAAAVEVIDARARGPAEALLAEFDAIEIKGALYDSLPKFKELDENGISRIPIRNRAKSNVNSVAPWDRVSCA